MAIKIHQDLLEVPGWEKVEEYGNERLAKEGLDDFSIFIKPVNFKDTEKDKAWGHSEGMEINYKYKPGERYLEVVLILDYSKLEHKESFDRLVGSLETFVETNIINQIWTMHE